MIVLFFTAVALLVTPSISDEVFVIKDVVFLAVIFICCFRTFSSWDHAVTYKCAQNAKEVIFLVSGQNYDYV